MVSRFNQIKDFFLPSWGELLLYALAGPGLLALLRVTDIWRMIAGNETIPPDLSPFLSDRISRFNSLAGTPAVWLVWMFIGSVCYMLTWFVISFVLTIHKDVDAANYVMPAKTKATYWRSVTSNSLLFVTSLIGFVGYLILALRVIAVLAQHFYFGLFRLALDPLKILYLLGTVAAIMATIYVFVRLLKIVVYAFKTTLVHI